MASLSNGDIVEARIVCQLGNQIGENIYHYRVSNLIIVAGPVTTANAAATLAAAYATPYANCMTSDANYFGVGCRVVAPIVTLEDGNSAFQIPGNSAFHPLPAQTSCILAIMTGLGGRRQRGRKYIPFPSTDMIGNDGRPNANIKNPATTVGGIYATAPTTVTNVGGSSCDLVAVLKHADNTTDDITLVVARNEWGTQKSRGGYGRPNVLPTW